MTFLEMYTLAEDIIGDSTAATGARIKKFINFGQKDFASRYDWPFLQSSSTFNTTSGTEYYDLSTTCGKVIDLRDSTNETYLPEYNERIFNSVKPSTDSADTGKPLYWYPVSVSTGTSSEQIRVNLYPIPDGTYTVKYNFFKNVIDLSADSDYSLIPAKYHSTILDYALMREFEKRRSSMANYYATKYEDGVIRAMQDFKFSDGLNQMQPPSGVRYGRDLRY